MDRYEKAIFILHNTKDGNLLQEPELWVIQEAVNNHLTELGWKWFEELFNRVKLITEGGLRCPQEAV